MEHYAQQMSEAIERLANRCEQLEAERDEARDAATQLFAMFLVLVANGLDSNEVKRRWTQRYPWLAETPSENAPVSAVDDQEGAPDSEAVWSAIPAF
jgi:hypothetical protein